MSQNPTRLPLYEGPAAWIATEMRQRHDWIDTLDAGEVIELKRAVDCSSRCWEIRSPSFSRILEKNAFILWHAGSRVGEVFLP